MHHEEAKQDEGYQSAQNYQPTTEYRSQAQRAGDFIGLDFEYTPGDPGL